MTKEQYRQAVLGVAALMLRAGHGYSYLWYDRLIVNGRTLMELPEIAFSINEAMTLPEGTILAMAGGVN